MRAIQGKNLYITFHEMDALVCLPRITTEQKRLGRKEVISLAFWLASARTEAASGLEDQDILGSQRTHPYLREGEIESEDVPGVLCARGECSSGGLVSVPIAGLPWLPGDAQHRAPDSSPSQKGEGQRVPRHAPGRFLALANEG